MVSQTLRVITRAKHCITYNRCIIQPKPETGGNDNLFEHNAIRRSSYETTDTGAFYVGRAWSQRGNVVRYNRFQDIHRPTERLALPANESWAAAFYLDDQMSGWDFYRNTIINATLGVLLGGGRRNRIHSNTFIDNDLDIHFDNRGMNWMADYCNRNCSGNREERPAQSKQLAARDQATCSGDASGPFCAVVTQARAKPYALREVVLACADKGATIATIGFADFGTPDVSGGCAHYKSSGACSDKALALGWADQCVGQPNCTLNPNELLPPKHPDPCSGVPKRFAVEATCSGTGGGKATISPVPQDPPAPSNPACFLHELEGVNYQQPPFSTHYPELIHIFDDHPCVPVDNAIEENQWCHSGSRNLTQQAAFINQNRSTVLSWMSTMNNNRQLCDAVLPEAFALSGSESAHSGSGALHLKSDDDASALQTPEPGLAGPPHASVVHEVEIFRSGDDGTMCFRVPMVVALPWGTLLAFAEARQWIGDGCYPNGATVNDTCKGTPPHMPCTFNTTIVVKASTNRGQSWGPMHSITRGHDFSVLYERASRRLILQYPSCAGSDCSTPIGSSMQVLSSPMAEGDVGPAAWGAPTVVDTLGACTGFNVGPGGGGLQLQHNALHRGRLVFCGHGNSDHANSDHQRVTGVWVSDDNASSWRLTATLEGFNECNLVEQRAGAIVLDSRNQVGPTNPAARSSCGCRLAATSTDGGESFHSPRTVPSLADSSCQGSMLSDGRAAGGLWYYTGPNTRPSHAIPGVFPGSSTRRANMTLSVSANEGETWSPLLQMWAGESEYSSAAVLPSGVRMTTGSELLAVAWERDVKYRGGG